MLNQRPLVEMIGMVWLATPTGGMSTGDIALVAQAKIEIESTINVAATPTVISRALSKRHDHHLSRSRSVKTTETAMSVAIGIMTVIVIEIVVDTTMITVEGVGLDQDLRIVNAAVTTVAEI